MFWLRFPLFVILASLTLLGQQPTITTVLNIGSADAKLSPGVIAVVSGTNYASGMTATVGGQNAPVTFILGTTIATIQIPYSTPLGPSNVTLRRGGLNSSAFSIIIEDYAPGIVPVDGGGLFPNARFGGFFHIGNVPVSAEDPAVPGESILAHCVGLGQTNPAVTAGVPAPSPGPVTLATPTVTAGAQAATLVSAIAAPGMYGLYHVAFRVPAGLNAGNQPVVVTIGGKKSNSMDLAVGAAPTAPPTISSVVNLGSVLAKLSPGVLAVVYGTNFGTTPTAQVGGRSAPVLFSSATQVNLHIPVELSPGATSLVVSSGTLNSSPFNLNLEDFAPAIIANTLLHVVGGLINAQNPLIPGESWTLLAVGLGQTNPAVPTGQTVPASPAHNTIAKPTVTVGGKAAEVLFAGLNPNSRGVYQLSLRGPTGLTEGNQPVVITIGGKESHAVNVPVGRPLPMISNILNGASFGSSKIASPGSFLTLFGVNVSSRDVLSGFPATDFDGVSVTFNGTPAPLFHLIGSQNQVNLLVPSELPESGTVNVQLKTSVGTSASTSITMVAADPGLFGAADPSNSSRRNASALFANTAWLVLPRSMARAFGIPDSCTGLSAIALCGQPAAPGENIQVYVTGLGKATPGGAPGGVPLPTGQVAPVDGSVIYRTVQTPKVTIGGIDAPVQFSGLAPGFAGLYQVNVAVPTGVSAGDDVPIVISMPNGRSHALTIGVR